MIIDHTDCLHEGIYDRRPDEWHSAFFEIFRDNFWEIRFCWKIIYCRSFVNDWKSISVIPTLRSGQALTIGRIQSFWYLDSFPRQARDRLNLRMTKPLEIPKIHIQAPEFLLDLECDSCIFSHRVDLEPITNNTRIEENRLQFNIRHFCNPSNIPTMKEWSIIFAFT